MFNFDMALLAADGTSPDMWNTIIQYCTYAVIIVVCVFVLILMSKRNRLPKHGELKKKLEGLNADIAALKTPLKRVKFYKSVSHVIYKADRLAYVAAMLAEKEKYADLSRIADLISEARNELAPYKFGKLEPEQSEGFDGAAQKVSEAIAVRETVIKRDGEIKKLNG